MLFTNDRGFALLLTLLMIGAYLEQHQVLGERVDSITHLVVCSALRALQVLSLVRLISNFFSQQLLNALMTEGVTTED